MDSIVFLFIIFLTYYSYQSNFYKNSGSSQLWSYFLQFGPLFELLYDNIVVTKLIAEIWEHGDIAKMKSHGARNQSEHTHNEKHRKNVYTQLWQKS